MAGSLIKVDEFTISSPVASVILGGGSSGSSGLNASIDSTYDVYMVKINNYYNSSSNPNRIRFTVSGTADTSANYDFAAKRLRTDTTFDNIATTNATEAQWSGTVVGTGTSTSINGILYLWNFNNASEYSFYTNEATGIYDLATDYLMGNQGGGVLTVAQACDGIQFYSTSTNIASGTFTLYGLKK
jgi:hypothetical protein